MNTQGPTRAQGETIVIIHQARIVTCSLKNGQQHLKNDDGELDRSVGIDSDGSHSWTVQLWGPWQRSEFTWRARTGGSHKLQQAALQKGPNRGPAEWWASDHLVGREWGGGEHWPGRPGAGEQAWEREVSCVARISAEVEYDLKKTLILYK